MFNYYLNCLSWIFFVDLILTSGDVSFIDNPDPITNLSFFVCFIFFFFFFFFYFTTNWPIQIMIKIILKKEKKANWEQRRRGSEGEYHKKRSSLSSLLSFRIINIRFYFLLFYILSSINFQISDWSYRKKFPFS